MTSPALKPASKKPASLCATDLALRKANNQTATQTNDALPIEHLVEIHADVLLRTGVSLYWWVFWVNFISIYYKLEPYVAPLWFVNILKSIGL